MKSSVLRRVVSVWAAVCLFFFVLTVSIGLPIYIRPFYYAHIEAMDLPESSGFTASEIKDAYDEVLDYLTLPGKTFGTGVMKCSEAGEAHFVDCKVLFDLNAGVLIASALSLIALFFLRKKLGPYRLGRHSSAFYAGISAVVLPLVLGGLAALDFDRAFVVFHRIFFPGKDNWLFDYYADEIIRVLPQEFFMHCGILISAGVLIQAIILLIWDFTAGRRQQ